MKKIIFYTKPFPLLTAITLLMISSCMTDNLYETSPDPMAQEESALLMENEFTGPDGANLKVNSSNQNQILAEIRKATAKYHQLEVAEGDGYGLDPHCVEVPGLGGMGQHAVNFGLVDAMVDPAIPEVLLYETGANGQKKLIAVEFIVVADPWDAENDGPPMIGNQPFDDHREIIIIDGEPVNAKGGPPFPHYQLHVWVWKNNPNGIYTPFNPNVNCQHAD